MQELDASDDGGSWHATDVHLEDLAVVAEKFVEVEDAVGDFVGSAENTMPLGCMWRRPTR